MWFIFALLSLVFAGLQSFAQKFAAEKRYEIYLISTWSALISSVFALGLFLATASLREFPVLFWWLGLASGLLFIAFSITRLESLQFIDAAIFFPLYKVVGPALVAAFGIFLLGEKISFSEFIGIVLSCLVPLLLITRDEHHRQKNLKLGLILMLISTSLAAIAAAVNGIAVKANAELALPLVVIANGCAAIFGIALYARRHRAKNVLASILSHSTKPMLLTALTIGLMQLGSFYFLLLAIAGNDLSLAYSVNAHYILIPVLLSVWFYKEHWNKQKALALVISMLALILLHR